MLQLYIIHVNNKTDESLNNHTVTADHDPMKLTVSKSLSPSKTGSLEGQKSEPLFSSSFLLDSDEKTRDM